MYDKHFPSPHPKGITLLLVMIILSLVSSIALAVTMLILRQFEQGADIQIATQAQNAADSGIERVLYAYKTKATQDPSVFMTNLKNEFGCSNPADLTPNSTYCVDEDQSLEYEDEVVAQISKDAIVTLDLFYPVTGGFYTADMLKLTGTADANAWVEVSWAAWETTTGVLDLIPSTTKDFFPASELATGKFINFDKDTNSDGTVDAYFINDPGTADSIGSCSPNPLDDTGCLTGAGRNFNYVVRIKALYEDIQNITVEAYDGCVDGGGASCVKTQIPTRVSIKIIGEDKTLKQAAQISIPWSVALAQLYDYVLFAPNDLTKLTQITPGFFTTGTIQAEIGTTYSAPAPPAIACNASGSICSPWSLIATGGLTADALCDNGQTGASYTDPHTSGGTCRFTTSNALITYDLSTLGLSEVDAKYYVNFRMGVHAAQLNEAMDFWIADEVAASRTVDESDTSSDIFAFRNQNGWVTCSQSVDLNETDKIQFKPITGKSTTMSFDWWSITTIPLATGCKFAGS